ncbi:Alpha N-terminal protein methyltransferase 1 [Capsicum chinense]|nr:Alpha N-terminal protein methyltransferase 1 [Capsicum chinense]
MLKIRALSSCIPFHFGVPELSGIVGSFLMALMEFTPDAERYDVIWVQWCIGHLADDDFMAFFKRAKVK